MFEWWERADPPWVLPNYVSDFTQALAINQAWIETGGITNSATANAVASDLPAPSKPQALSDGESEVGASNEALPLLRWIVPKVQLSDEVEHILDKGVWATMSATHRSWQMFVNVSTPAYHG